MKESTATLAYPNDFTLAVQPTSGYETCTSTSTVLSISQFNAITANGNIDLIGNTYNYNYQWYKNNLPIANATTPTLSLTDALQNGNYTLKITIPNYGIITSNTFTVNLALENVIISSSGILCQNSTVLLSSNISNVGYQYQWYKNGDAILNATSSTYMASLEGDYYVIARNGQCEKQSNTIALGIASIAVTSTNQILILFCQESRKLFLFQQMLFSHNLLGIEMDCQFLAKTKIVFPYLKMDNTK